LASLVPLVLTILATGNRHTKSDTVLGSLKGFKLCSPLVAAAPPTISTAPLAPHG